MESSTGFFRGPVGMITPPQRWVKQLQVSLLPALEAAPRASLGPMLLIQFLGHSTYMGVSKNGDTPKWMVYNGKPY